MARPRFTGPFPCCRHCDPADDWHVTRGAGAHGDLCPEGCGSATAGGAVHLGREGGGIAPRCGHPHWSLVTPDEGAVTCGLCLRWLDMEPCGTPAAYRRHLRHEGKPVRCISCLRAEARQAEDRRVLAA